MFFSNYIFIDYYCYSTIFVAHTRILGVMVQLVIDFFLTEQLKAHNLHNKSIFTLAQILIQSSLFMCKVDKN